MRIKNMILLKGNNKEFNTFNFIRVALKPELVFIIYNLLRVCREI